MACVFPAGRKPFISLGHLNLARGHWMQIGLTWNEAENDCRLYLNGLLVATSTSFDYRLLREANSGTIYAGHLSSFSVHHMRHYAGPLLMLPAIQRWSREDAA